MNGKLMCQRCGSTTEVSKVVVKDRFTHEPFDKARVCSKCMVDVNKSPTSYVEIEDDTANDSLTPIS